MRKNKNSITRITLKHIQEKLGHIHKDVEQNSKDIVKLQEQVAMGRGGLKVIVWIGAIIGGILGAIKLKGFI